MQSPSIKMIKAIVKKFYETFKLYASFQVFSVKNKETTYCVVYKLYILTCCNKKC